MTCGRACLWAAAVALLLSSSIGAGELPAAIASIQGCINCSSCQSGHDTDEGTPLSWYSDWPDGIHGCKPSTCGVHGICGGLAKAGEVALPDRLDEVETAVAAGDVDRLNRLIADRDAAIVLVSERQAVQVIGCGGNVVGHFKLPSALLAALAD